MFKTSVHERIERRFLRNVNLLKDSRPWQRNGIAKTNNNLKLKSAASRITVPSQFQPYIDIIERRTNYKFKGDYKLSPQQVVDADRLILAKYKKSNFDFSRLNRDALIRASARATVELGFTNGQFQVDPDLYKHTNSFPQTSSACYPTYQKKSNPEAKQLAVEFAGNYLNIRSGHDKLVEHLFSEVTTLFHRFTFKMDSEGNINPKIRPIWGVPFGISIVESYFFRKIVDLVPQQNLLGSRNYTSLGMSLRQISDRIISKFRQYPRNDVLSMDLKNFDSTIPAFMWALFYANIEEEFDYSTGHKDHLIALMIYHCYTPFCYKSSEVQFQRGGTPSGCLITALFNSWVNRVVFNYAHEERGVKPPLSDLCVLGDDNLYLIRSLSVKYLYNVYERFGLEVNKEKTEVRSTQEDFSFLGYIWNRNDEAYQKESWFVTHLCLPSSFYSDVGMPLSLFFTYRAISVCIPLVNGYSTFMRLIGFEDYVFKELYDKYKRGEDTTIDYVSSDNRKQGIKFPFSLFIEGTWAQKVRGSIDSE